jgi:xanthine dehydrogenase YagS FAD-binding subunit
LKNFKYQKAGSVEEAIKLQASSENSKYLAGGTNLIDHLKLGVENPDSLIDVRHLTSGQISQTENGLLIGAGVTNTSLAYHPKVASHYPALSKAILAGASPQLRNAATTGGNLLQRTRCYYFRDIHSPCNKREPGSGCSAIPGINRIHALLGTSDQCIATHPSDMCVAMMAFDTTILVTGRAGKRTIPISEFYVPYGEDPSKENVLQEGDIITAVELPRTPWFAHSAYVKARDRASYEFALASAAVALDIHGGIVKNCRVALGGVGTKPWRAHFAEGALIDKPATRETFLAAADAELVHAVPRKDNGFKIELCKRVIVAALTNVVKGGEV